MDWKVAFRRRVRVAAGSVQSAGRLLWQGKRGWPFIFWWEVISHRIARTLIAPYCLLILLLSNVLLLGQDSFFVFTFFAQLFFYSLTILCWFFPARRFVSGLLIWPVFFIVAHLAMIKGAWLLWSGKATVVWEPVDRTKTPVSGKNE